VLLFTGKGGVGKTTAAAGTALYGARRGQRTLVLSTDAAHSLADAFGTPIGAEPTEIEPCLSVQQVDAQRRFERSWGDIQRYLLSVLDTVGVDPIAAEELTVLPGAEEVLALLEVRDQARSGRWDVIVVDCAPTAETLRLLALPEALGWYMDRVLPVERKVVRMLKPVLTRAAGVPMPHDTVFDAIERLHADLAEVRDMLTGPTASVRLVLTPESVVVAEARRSLTSLSLYGYRVDGVIANRVFPGAGADLWRRQWVAAQQSILAEVETSFAPIAVWRSAYRGSEPVGLEELADFAADLYRSDDPFAVPEGQDPVDVRRSGSDVVLRVALPFAEKGTVDLARHGDELVVTVGSYRRLLALPVALRKAKVRGATMRDGALVVRFDFGGTVDGAAPHADVQHDGVQSDRGQPDLVQSDVDQSEEVS
jgi:arsenite/tail-anchored protein-transporting ATPase